MSDFNDEHSGMGGSYVIDETGKRVLQERTAPVQPEQPATAAVTAKPGKTTKQVKGVSNA